METREKVYNLDYLHELSHGNEEFVKEMIRIFLAEMPEEIQNLENSIKEKNYTAIRHAAHKLKSTIPFVGLNFVIGKEVFEIEDLASKQLDLEKIELLFVKIKEMCNKAAEELKDYPQ
jgi:HPt (histidine-containing phosphotransfer) domain-containing protein